MTFIGSGRRLAPEDIARAAALIGCDEAAVKAVLAVEARGRGFDGLGRPVILYEPHVFWRCLPAIRRPAAEAARLAWPKWRAGQYPASQDARYDQLERAMAIDEAAALKAASWGLGQVLGENHKVCGFAAVGEMVAACVESEGRQLDVMVGFIVGSGLAQHLARHEWADFARRYNGPGYRANRYDERLAAAWAAAWVAPSPPAGGLAPGALADGMLALGDKGAAVQELQQALSDRGFPPGGVDGDFGPMTGQAVRAFQRARRLRQDGKVGALTGRALGLMFWG